MKKILKGLLFAFVAVLGLTLTSCGEHKHDLVDGWKRDSATHWHECTECEEYVDMAVHQYGDWVLGTDVCNRKRTCEVCGYVQTQTVDHTFEWTLVEGEKCLYDGVCKVCGEKKQEEKHNYVDHFCTVCEESDVVIFYLRGDMNGWLNDGFVEEYTFVVDYTNFTATLEVEIDNTKGWKVANHDWSIEFNAKTIKAEDGLLVDAGNVYVAKSGSYKFTITGLDGDNPSCSIEALHSHEFTWTLQEGKTCDYNGVCSCGLTSTKVEHTFVDGVCTCGAYDVQDYYVKGNFLEVTWGPADANKLAFDPETMTASMTVDLVAGNEFKVGTHDGWEFGFDANAVPAGAFEEAGGNFKCVKAGTYVITIAGLDQETKTISVTVAEPVTYWIKGTMNEWSCNDDYKLTYDAETNSASILLTVTAEAEFKISDEGWVIDFGYNEDKSALVQKGSNMTVAAGTYLITVNNVNSKNATATIAPAYTWALSSDQYAKAFTEAGSEVDMYTLWRLYIIVDGEGKIAYMCEMPKNGYGNPNSTSYIRHSDYADYKENPAFTELGEPSGEYNTVTFKSIIPEGGFALEVYSSEAGGQNLMKLITGVETYAEHGINTNTINVDNVRLSYDATTGVVLIVKGQ